MKRFVVTLILVVVIGSASLPVSVQAASRAELLQQIEQLTKILVLLQQQLALKLHQEKKSVTTIPELGLGFDHPEDWLVSDMVEKKFEGKDVKMVRVYPEGIDPTAVWFFNIEGVPVQSFDFQAIPSGAESSFFKTKTLNGRKATERIYDFTHNDCTKTVTFIEHDGSTYGSEVVACPTHPAGYDQERVDIAESLKII